jgi:F420-dependent oxidoreductase-like protein
MRLCIVAEGQEGVGWARWLDLARRCEALGFEALFRSDHYLSTVGPERRDCLDAWATISALAAVTERIRLGTLVSPVGFRHPSELAKVVTTVDHVSNGRIELGLGAGWYEAEHRAFGFPFADTPTRMAVFAEQLEIVARQLSGERFDFHGAHYALENCEPLPLPVQRPRPPIVIGGSGGRPTVDAAVRFADEYNTPYLTPEGCVTCRAKVIAGCERAGRDPASLRFSLMTGFVIGADAADVRRHGQGVMRWENGGDDLEAFLASHRDDWIIGTVEEAAERIALYAEAGVERLYLQHLDHENPEALELIARELAPRVTRAIAE